MLVNFWPNPPLQVNCNAHCNSTPSGPATRKVEAFPGAPVQGAASAWKDKLCAGQLRGRMGLGRAMTGAWADQAQEEVALACHSILFSGPDPLTKGNVDTHQ